jgi:hypothetical protein
VSIDQPAADVGVTTGAVVQFAGSASDPDGQLPLSHLWTFPACASPTSATVEDPGGVTFACDPGAYPVTYRVCDSAGQCAQASRTVSVLGACQFLPQTGWSVAFVDSEETTGENGRATNAIDGNPATIWHTRWSGVSPGHPHELRIDTGETRTLCGFGYLPRQDGGTNGMIRGYDLAVSTNGTTWTTVASGTLLSSPSTALQVIDFAAVQARYVRLRSLSAVNNGPYASAAEIRLKGQ